VLIGGAVAALAVAAPARAQETPLARRVSVPMTALPLREALDRVAAAANIRLTYVSELLPLDRPCTTPADSATVLHLLNGLLAGVRVTPVAAGGNRVVLAPSQVPLHDAASDSGRLLPRAELERAVVTGTNDGGTARPLTVALAVVDRETLASIGEASVPTILGATVPGLWAWPQPPSSFVARYGSVRGASSLGTTYPKVYVDGVNVANPLLFTTLEPENVERIEVIRGPQGAALYGADAISGVINVITRVDAPAGESGRGTLFTSGGTSASAFGPSVLAQEHRATAGFGSPLASGRLAASYASLGDYYAGAASHHASASGGVRRIFSQGLITATGRVVTAASGAAPNPLVPAADDSAATQHLTAYTLGAAARWVSGPAWSHNGVIGIDGYRLRNFANDYTPFASATDSALRAARGGADRTTLRISSTWRGRDAGPVGLSLSGAVEHSLLRQETPVIALGNPGAGVGGPRPQARPQATASGDNARLVTWLNDFGVTAQADVAVRDRWFATAGLRIERNDGYLTSPRYSALPVLGASWVADAGPATVKLRAAFGSGMRAPRTAARETLAGSMRMQALGRDLQPERQSGVEAGADLFVGRAFTAQLTLFDQRADGLIQQVVVPSTTGGRNAPVHLSLEYQNVGAITNRGLELQATVHHGPFALTGSAAFVRSLIASVATGYSGELHIGDRALGVPARTLAATASWKARNWQASLTATRAADWVEYDRIALARAYTGFDRRDVPLWGNDLRGYWRTYDGVTNLRATVARRLTPSLSLTVTGENLLGEQVGQPDNVTIVPGRTITTGVRWTRF
jgi:outer membrane receptor protein involved in Fe transport